MITKILKLDENNQYGFAMAKPIPMRVKKLMNHKKNEELDALKCLKEKEKKSKKEKPQKILIHK